MSGNIGGPAISIVALLIGIILALMIFWQVNSSITMTPSAAGGTRFAGDLTDSWNATNDSASVIFSLLPIVAIIMIAGIMLYYISRFGGGV